MRVPRLQGVVTMTLQDRIGARNTNKGKCDYRLTLKLLLCLMVLCVVSLSGSMSLKAQDEETTRKLWDTAFINSGRKKALPRRVAKRTYRIATPNVPTAGVNGETVVGVTLWRLRRATSTDSGERLIVHEGADAADWLPERISTNARLAQG